MQALLPQPGLPATQEPPPDVAARDGAPGTPGAQPTAQANSTALQPVSILALTAIESYKSSSDRQYYSSALDETNSHVLSIPAAAVNPDSLCSSSSSSTADNSQPAVAGKELSTQLADGPSGSAAQQIDSATAQRMSAPATVNIRPISAGAGLPTPTADNDFAAVAVHTADGVDGTPLAGLRAAIDDVQASIADSAVADKVQISSLSGLQISSLNEVRTSSICSPAGTVPGNSCADSTAAAADQPHDLDSTATAAADQRDHSGSTAADVQQPNKGKGRATAAELQRMAAQASKGDGVTTKTDKLTKLERYQLRVAYSEEDFIRRVLAGMEAGAGPSSARVPPLKVAHSEADPDKTVLADREARAAPSSVKSPSLMVATLHCAAEIAYAAAGATTGIVLGLRRAFWQP